MNQNNIRWNKYIPVIYAHKGWIIAYLILVMTLIAISIMPLGSSVCNNESVYVDLTLQGERDYKRIDTRNYSETYTLSVTENIQFHSFQIIYSAEDEHFKGIITEKIVGEEGVIVTTSAQIGSTGSNETYRAVDLYCNTDAHKTLDAQLQKDHTYTLQLQIDTNMPGYYLQEFTISEPQDAQCTFVNDKIIIADIYFTPTKIVRYWDAFYGFILLFIVVGGCFLLRKLNIISLKSTTIIRIGDFVRGYYSEIILLLVFLFLAIYEFYFSYVQNTYISPDSSSYLMEAAALLKGHGFNIYGETGYFSWFASYAIGYPALIAIVAFVTGKNVYLASKILAVLIIGLFLLLLYIRFRKEAWVYSVCLFNIGFLNIYKYTWSEIPFILGLLIFCLIFERIIQNDKIKMYWFMFWGFSGAFVTVCRYFGAFSLIAMAIVFICYLCKYLFSVRNRERIIGKKIVGCMIAGVIAGLLVGSYLITNYIHAGTFTGTRNVWWDDYPILTNALYSAFVKEICNALRTVLPDTMIAITRHYQIWIIIIFLLIVSYLITKYKPRDFRAVFIGVGIFYYVVFIMIRYHSSMDTFGPRFFAPASMLITIGLLGFLIPFLEKHKNKIAPVVICVLILMTTGLSYNLKDFDREETAYARLVKDLSASLEKVPFRSVILYNDFDYRAGIIRPDIYYRSSGINSSDTMNDLFARYGISNCICVKAKHIKDILFYPIYDYDKSVVEFFDDIVTEDTPDEELLIISVKDKKILR